jgi:hypothetical protein
MATRDDLMGIAACLEQEAESADSITFPARVAKA